MEERDFLLALREYIEQVEVRIESECGVERSLDELIAADEMPTIYEEVLRRLAAA